MGGYGGSVDAGRIWGWCGLVGGGYKGPRAVLARKTRGKYGKLLLAILTRLSLTLLVQLFAVRLFIRTTSDMKNFIIGIYPIL